jgi:hypothetical protein
MAIIEHIMYLAFGIVVRLFFFAPLYFEKVKK